ncbi:Coat F domain-containing protein [Caldanaerobius fijiensis DSM 17918]|uniref:Coat F domain-containing protein n=1 Tax=Caldanaerobius fijiensis DSM 17918 TaxID=1121256 RepID=A0A1M5B7I4_9THEO|nr:spore coat protein [Caldanaerobius fijiensis]SHF38483.1 Coat F domain-containing protein [Caldanaerobius fijiensis DSM 17918]
MPQMTDKDYMMGVLGDLKFEIEGLSHAIVESADESLRRDFTSVLNTCFTDQKKVFDAISQRGWYKVRQASPQDIAHTRNTFQTPAII